MIRNRTIIGWFGSYLIWKVRLSSDVYTEVILYSTFLIFSIMSSTEEAAPKWTPFCGESSLAHHIFNSVRQCPVCKAKNPAFVRESQTSQTVQHTAQSTLPRVRTIEPVIDITGDSPPIPATSNSRAIATVQSGPVRFGTYNAGEINKARSAVAPRTKEARGKGALTDKFKCAVVMTALATQKVYDSLGGKTYAGSRFISMIPLHYIARN